MPGVELTPPGPAEDTRRPVLGGGLGPYSHRLLSDPGQLTRLGAFTEHLPPGSRSGFRHWHQAEDEMVYVLSGEVVPVEEGEVTLHPGETACWPAGNPVGHYLENRGAGVARYLVTGTRAQTDRVIYPGHELITEKDGAARRYMHADGRPRMTTGEAK
jgi:uncharacterized cupin superfamily protein